MASLAIAANGLRKSYGDEVVLDGVDLAVPEGTILSLLGPNGGGMAEGIVWIAVGTGLVGPNAEAASNNAMPLILLPLVSSAFVPTDTMPGWFRPIAEFQPFAPAIETLRGLPLGTGTGHNGWLAVGWCLGLTALGYLRSAAKFNRDPRWRGKNRPAVRGQRLVPPRGGVPPTRCRRYAAPSALSAARRVRGSGR